MDITQFIVASRDKALLYGDYNTYRTQLAHRLLNCRKKLHVATRRRGKYNHQTNSVTAEQVSDDISHVHLQLLSAERAYAQAMAMKAGHAASKKGSITGRTRSHIVSRLDKAAKTAGGLSTVLEDAASGATDGDRLEAQAYAALLRGAAAFEKQAWALCLTSYAAVWAAYSALSSASAARADVFRDLLSDTVEPSLRYAAYQSKMPRSKPIPIIAREALSADSKRAPLVDAVNALDLTVLQPEAATTASEAGADSDGPMGGVPGGIVASTRTLTWRSRAVTIEDAAIASAWAALDVAKARLAARLTAAATGAHMAPKDMAAAYDDVLTVSQDAVDATKAAIDDLRSEGLPQSDPSVQTLYIARTAATFEMISERIGRNRVLTGPHDGALAHLDAATAARGRKRKGRKSPSKQSTAEAPGRILARLKEIVVLYDGTLQSLESVKELPGVAADAELTQQLEATAWYFLALKSLALARSHSVAGHATNALALVKYGFDQCAEAVPVLAKSDNDVDTADQKTSTPSPLRNIHVTAADGRFLLGLLQAELQRARALVDLEKHQAATAGLGKASTAGPPTAATALSESINIYPTTPIDMTNIVTYPPRLEPMPVNPMFLDIAWNYIEYPKNRAAGGTSVTHGATTKQVAADSTEKPQKRGWFGFGR